MKNNSSSAKNSVANVRKREGVGTVRIKSKAPYVSTHDKSPQKKKK